VESAVRVFWQIHLDDPDAGARAKDKDKGGGDVLVFLPGKVFLIFFFPVDCMEVGGGTEEGHAVRYIASALPHLCLFVRQGQSWRRA
jgi:hypothetical protein